MLVIRVVPRVTMIMHINTLQIPKFSISQKRGVRRKFSGELYKK